MRRIVLLIVLSGLLTGVVAAQAGESSPSAGEAFVWAFVFFVIGVLVVLPWLSDTYYNIMIRRRLLDDIGGCQDRAEKLTYYDRLLRSFAERKGMSRFSLMISVTLIIGAVVLYLVLHDPESELLKNTVGVLTGALASIIGFYFGGRTSTPQNEGPAAPGEKEAAAAKESTPPPATKDKNT